tara:strand:- start:763 stop:1272 length:510 start_codon:yes stop_codon:yes gene_type:complete
MALSKILSKAIKKVRKKKPSAKTIKEKAKARAKVKPLKSRTSTTKGNVFAPPEATVNKRAKVLKDYKAGKIKIAKPKTSSDYVKVPEKYYRDEDKYEKMMRAGKKLSDVQLKAYSKAIKFTIDNMAEIDGRQYVTRKAKDTIKGTVSHALKEMDFLPKKYLDLYKKRKK